MTKALSVDLRKRVVAVIDGGLSRRQAAARFGVSVSSAIRWQALARRTGAATPKRQGGDRRSGRIKVHADMILGAVAGQPEITLAEILIFPEGVRRIIYTTDAIEALNSKIRRAVRTRGHFPGDDAAMKLLYLVLNHAADEWKRPPREWGEAKSQFAVIFGERFVI